MPGTVRPGVRAASCGSLGCPHILVPRRSGAARVVARPEWDSDSRGDPTRNLSDHSLLTWTFDLQVDFQYVPQNPGKVHSAWNVSYIKYICDQINEDFLNDIEVFQKIEDAKKALSNILSKEVFNNVYDTFCVGMENEFKQKVDHKTVRYNVSKLVRYIINQNITGQKN